MGKRGLSNIPSQSQSTVHLVRNSFSTLAFNANPLSASRPGNSRRTITFLGDPKSTTEAIVTSTSTVPGPLKRSVTALPPLSTAPIITATSQAGPSNHPDRDDEDFSVLRLDLSVGAARQAENYMVHLEKASISALLDTRFAAALDHLALLQKRIYDPQSRVLLTGDVKAG